MSIIAVTILLIYSFLLLAVLVTWNNLKYQADAVDDLPGVSVIVAMRNEAQQLPQLLSSLQDQDYPGPFEVILVDDASDDESAQIAQDLMGSLDLKVFRLPDSNAPGLSRKKLAITKGVSNARYPTIMVTDADCEAPAGWIRLTSQYLAKHKAHMVCGIVRWSKSSWSWQPLLDQEFAALQSIGAASLSWGTPNMCNGANLAFTKNAFQEVNGYEGYEEVTSGDDEFLLYKVWTQFNGGVYFLKHPETVVTTLPPQNWREFWHQRRRWSGKWKHHKRFTTKFLGILVLLVHLSFLVALLTLILNPAHYLAGVIGSKILAEALLLIAVLRFQRRTFKIGWFLIGQFLYSIYALSFGFMANFGSFNWKNRQYS